MKKFSIILLLLASVASAFGQESQEIKGRPNVPGILQIDYGLSFSADVSMPFKVIGSRTLNFYYLQDIKFKNEKFSFNPGVGVGMDRFKFDSDDNNDVLFIVHNSDSSYFDALTELDDVKKSFLNATYIDVPIEFRFSSRPDDPTRSFNLAVGGKVGVLVQGKSKYKYKKDNSVHKIKEIHPFHITPFRYTTYLRVGIGGFSVYGNYSLSALFKPGEGHMDKEPHIATVGISFNGF